MTPAVKDRPSANRLPIRRLAVLFVVLSFVPLALLAFLTVRLASDALEQEVEARVRSAAEASGVAIQKEMQGLLEVVSSYAQRPTVIGALSTTQPGADDRARIAFHLRELRMVRPGIAAAFLADQDGRLIDVVPATPTIVGKDFSFRDWYQGVTRTRRAYLSEAYESQATGRPRVVAATSHDPLVAASLQGRSGVVTRDAPGGKLLTAYVPVAQLGWTVTASIPRDTAFASVGRLRSTVFTIAGVLGLLLLGGLVLVVLTLRARGRAEEEAHLARAQAEQANELNAQLAAIVRSSDDAILSTTLEGIVTSWNPGAERLYGYKAGELIGQSIGVLIPAHRSGEEWSILQDVLAGATRAHYETERKRKDGVLLQVSLTVSPIKNRKGEIIAASSIARDVTEQRQAEQAARRAKADADRANHAKSEFLSRMSHELRTPLNAILGFGQLLAMDGLDSNQRDGVQQILKAGGHLLELINEVLDISRIEAGRLSLSLEPVAVGETVAEALDLVRPLAAERDVVLGGGAQSEESSVLADRQRLKQVLLNLLSNAIKYNRQGGKVTVDVTQTAEERLRLAISDTGAGISPESLDRLFSPFERLGADETAVEGTGLGLALSKGLVDAMGGRLGIDSRVGEGSTFWIELAVAEGQVEQLDEAELPEATVEEGKGGPARTVLYIEDNLSNLKLVESVLAHRSSISLLPAMQGGLGLELAREHPCDLILLDLHLPDLSGREVLMRLKADPATSDIPVVVLSADATPGQIERLREQGASEYLTKPLDVTRFLEVLDEQLFSETEAEPSPFARR